MDISSYFFYWIGVSRSWYSTGWLTGMQCPPPHPRESWGFKGEQQWFVLGVLIDSPAHGHFIILLLVLNQGQQVLLLLRPVDWYAVCPPTPTPPLPPKIAEVLKKESSSWFVLGVLSDSPARGPFIILTLLNQGQQVRLLHRLGDRYALCGALGVESGWDLLHQTQTESDISLENEWSELVSSRKEQELWWIRHPCWL